MKARFSFLAIALVALVVSAPLVAQGGPGPGHHCGRHAGGPPAYDLAAETSISGRVAEVLPQSCPQAGIHLRLTTSSGDLEIALGPSSFLAELGASFAVGDEIEVTGAKPGNQAPADFLARSVKKSDASFELRDTQGNPRWPAGASCARRGRQGSGMTD